jgi:hypothetical protein
MTTQNAVIILSREVILVCAIPPGPLLPQPPDFFNHNPIRTTPLFTIPLPDDIVHHCELMRWKTFSSWYFGIATLYFDMFCQFYGILQIYRFQIMLKPDLSTASLHVINTSEPYPRDFCSSFFQEYKICENTLFSCWFDDDHDHHPGQYECGVYTGSKVIRFPFILHGGPAAMRLSPDLTIKLASSHSYRYDVFLCPASGRFVLRNTNYNNLVVFDLF